MEFGVLGPVEVARDGVAVHLGGPKPRTVLALLLAAERGVSDDELIEALWGDNPSSGTRRTLQSHVYNLRTSLGDGVVVRKGSGYGLVVERGQVDALRFEDEVVASRALLGTRPSEAADRLRRALALWRGPAYGDVPQVTRLFVEARRLDELRVGATEDLIEAELALGRHMELVGELEALRMDHPLRERLCGQHMLALYRSGRQADALHVHEHLRATLADQLGADPSAPLRELHLKILKQDPSLELPDPMRSDVTAQASSPGRRGEASPGQDRTPMAADTTRGWGTAVRLEALTTRLTGRRPTHPGAAGTRRLPWQGVVGIWSAWRPAADGRLHAPVQALAGWLTARPWAPSSLEPAPRVPRSGVVALVAPWRAAADRPMVRPVGLLATWLLGLLAAGVIIDAFAAVVQALPAPEEHVLGGGSGSATGRLAALDGADALWVLQLLVLIATASLFVAWFHRAYVNLPSLGASHRRFRTGWAIGSWFVPFVNLVRPKQIADEIWQTSAADRRDPPLGRLTVNLWWGLWLLAAVLLLLAAISGVVARSTEAAAMPGREGVLIAANAMRAAAGVAALAVVHLVTSGQQSHAGRRRPVVDPPSPVGAPTGVVVGVATAVTAGILATGTWLLAPPPPDDTAVLAGGLDARLAAEIRGTQPPAGPDADREPVVPTRVLVDYLRVGDCFDDPLDGPGRWVELMPCLRPHDREAFAVHQLPFPRGTAFPGVNELFTVAEDACRLRFVGYVGTDYDESTLMVRAYYPEEAAWDAGNRQAVCALHDRSFAKLEGSMAGSRR